MRGSSASVASLSTNCSLESKAEWVECQIAPFLFPPGEITVRAMWEGKVHQSSFQAKFRNPLLKLNFFPVYLQFSLKLDKIIFFSFVSVRVFCRQLVKSVILKITKNSRVLRNAKNGRQALLEISDPDY